MPHWIKQINQLGNWSPSPRWGAVILAIGVGVLVVLDAMWISGGVNPSSLRMDDQWVGTLVKHAQLTQLFELAPPTPMGFVLLQRIVTAIPGWGEWQLQVIAIACALAQIPLIGWIAWRATNRVSLGLVAAGLLSGSRTLMSCSLRVKQYSLEGLIVLILIALAMRCMMRSRWSDFAWLTAAAVIALPFSFTAVAAGMVIINVLAVHLVLSHRDDKPFARAIIVCWAAYGCIALLWLWLAQLGQANEMILDFWTIYYPRIDSVAGIWEYVGTHLATFFSGALPSGLMLPWLALAAPLAIVLLSCRRPTRSIGLGLAVFYAGMLVLAAFGKYPLGAGRTDVFSYPITILAIVGTIWCAARFVPVLPALVLAIIAVRTVVYFPEVRVGYSQGAARSVVEHAEAILQQDDALVIESQSRWAVGCYGPWLVTLSPPDQLTRLFVITIHRPQTIVLPPEAWRQSVASDGSELDQLLARRPHRIIYISMLDRSSTDDAIASLIESRGYQMRDHRAGSGGVLWEFVLD